MHLPIQCPICSVQTLAHLDFEPADIPLLEHLYFPLPCAGCGHELNFQLKIYNERTITILIPAPPEWSENIKWKVAFAH